MSQLAGRHIILGLGGGIACYKMCTVTSRLVQAQAKVTVLMTPGAAQFVQPLTFEALSGRPVYLDAWTAREHHDPQHIELARSADAMLIAPCTMNLASRLAHGMGDDVVTLIASAIDRASTPVAVAPSMNAMMWSQPATQRNMQQLADDGFQIIEPGLGWQACRTDGPGRLPEPEALVTALESMCS